MAGNASLSGEGLQVSKNFKTSYTNYSSYPSDLTIKNPFPSSLVACKKRLDDFASKLFLDEKNYIPFREFTGVGPNGGLQKTEIVDDISLRDWLGDKTSTPSGLLLTKKDPRCRFIFINADSSRSPLKITRLMLARILTYHQVMPEYLEFLYVFGSQSDARDLRFSGFRQRVSLAKAPDGSELRDIGRSGRQFQLSYNLKAVACKSKQEWSIRQAAIHHQFDLKEGTTLWIVTQGNLAIKRRVQEMTAARGRPEDRAFTTTEDCFKSSLTTHLLYCHWSAEEWRWYIQWLEETIEKETASAIYSTRNTERQHTYTSDDIQIVQHHEDKINEAVMVMETNTTIFICLRDFYENLIEKKDFKLKLACENETVAFLSEMDDLICNTRMQIARAQVLVKITADRKSLILQHLQNQDSVQMKELTNLTIKIGTMAQREAIAMRIITVVTLIYLPATFVSTFFSTDIIKYQNPDTDSETGTTSNIGPYMGSFSSLAMERWLQVTIPLTFITLALGWAAFRISGKKADQEFDGAQLPFYKNDTKTNLGA